MRRVGGRANDTIYFCPQQRSERGGAHCLTLQVAAIESWTHMKPDLEDLASLSKLC